MVRKTIRKTKNSVVQAAKRIKVGPPGEKGQSLVEMAIITPLLLLLFIGVIEVGWAIRGYIRLPRFPDIVMKADAVRGRFIGRFFELLRSSHYEEAGPLFEAFNNGGKALKENRFEDAIAIFEGAS